MLNVQSGGGPARDHGCQRDSQPVPLRKSAHILIVEDDPDQRFIVETLLKHEGYTVTTAEDGFHALESIVAEEPDIIVLDFLMPILDGYDVLAEVRAQSPRTPVIVLSGAPDAKERAH